MNWEKLCDNAAKFKKKPEVINLILVRKKSKIQKEGTRHNLNLPEKSHEGRNDINNNNTNNNDATDEQADELTENNKELKRNLQIQIKAMGHCFWLQLQLTPKLPKMKLTKEIEGSTNKVLSRYLTIFDVKSILDITDKVYILGIAIALKLRIKQPKRNETAKKLIKDIKELHQWITKTSHELFGRKVRKKTTKKEKNLKAIESANW